MDVRAMNSCLMWFRTDLRLTDNPALAAAVERGQPVVPVFIWSSDEEGKWTPGAASRWWLHQSLENLDAALRRSGSRLIIRQGSTLEVLRQLIRQTRADSVFWNRRYEPALISRDETIRQALRADGLTVQTFNSALLFEPDEIRNAAGKPFRVFTPFWKACLKWEKPTPTRPAPKRLLSPKRWPSSLPLASLQLPPAIDWAKGIRRAWMPGERGAQTALRQFLRDGVSEYSRMRDRPDIAGTSRLSPHLHFGEIGPRQVWEALRSGAVTPYLRQLGWREFAYHVLIHFPETTDQPLRPEYVRFPWSENAKALRAWQRGRTGYPVVDAGMRQLWTTGWMHNRVRMIVASFLVKDLLIPWQRGAEWFWDTLVDADLANNTLGWQWTAGCGADAAPFFRIFNPVGQGERFDPNGDYVRRWVPELAKLPTRWIHQPWQAPASMLRDAGVVLGRTYPRPIVDHAVARARTLQAFARMRRR
jgi:deoxyribodipyrimidine photo-lyase